MAAGLLADRAFGEVRRFHPLVGFGRWAGWVERGPARGRSTARTRPAPALPACWRGRWRCCRGWGLVLWLRGVHPHAHWVVDVGLLYLALGGRSLVEHAQAIAVPLAAGNLDEARTRVGWIVSRDTSALDAEGVAKAATESVLENGNDAVFGALFWFVLGGGAGALLFRLANTLDAMWGYRTPRYLQFGWAAARIDDVLNFVPARLTALTYALLGRTRRALACWRNQAPGWDSPNAGPVMAAGAGALGVRLGGAAIYHGHEEVRPALGEGRAPDGASIVAAVGAGAPGCLAVAGRRLRRSAWWRRSREPAMLEHGGRLRRAAEAYGIPLADWLDLSTGINPQGYPVPPVPADAWLRLPEDDDGLEAAAADYYGSAHLLPVAGSQPAIQLLPAVLRGERVSLLAPGYAEHAHAWRDRGAVAVGADEIDAAVAHSDIVVLVQPNNPTGVDLAASACSSGTPALPVAAAGWWWMRPSSTPPRRRAWCRWRARTGWWCCARWASSSASPARAWVSCSHRAACVRRSPSASARGRSPGRRAGRHAMRLQIVRGRRRRAPHC